MRIRLTQDNDADAIRRLDSLAFSPWWKQLTGTSKDLPPRRHDHILMLLEKDPEGCFVAEEGGAALGFIFSRTWGRVGWFGTFGVLPEHQGRGIGKQLIAASLEYLRRDPQRVIGLETMPESPDNLGLYMKQGFEARFLTMLLSKAIDRPPKNVEPLPLWSQTAEEDHQRWLDELREAADRITPRLDYTKEVLATTRYDLGETLILTENEAAIGMGIVWFSSSREAMHEDEAVVQVMMIHPDYTTEARLHKLLGAAETLAYVRGKRKLVLAGNAQHGWALTRLLDFNYHIDRAMVRMVLKGTDQGLRTDPYVDLSRWAG
ncbi:MAG TPA: GNAT family N-acetyltransferase [Anaerolineae bacterium]|nr:GNAT family N-acetyltransferase [Anaerolineae bacterium]